ncbi:hypothetical protein ACOME3_004244 [Neoechinorhynchus agilis]
MIRLDGTHNRSPKLGHISTLTVSTRFIERHDLFIRDPDGDVVECQAVTPGRDCFDCDFLKPLQDWVWLAPDCTLMTRFPLTESGKYYRFGFVIKEKDRDDISHHLIRRFHLSSSEIIEVSSSTAWITLLPKKSHCRKTSNLRISVQPKPGGYLNMLSIGKSYKFTISTNRLCRPSKLTFVHFTVAPKSMEILRYVRRRSISTVARLNLTNEVCGSGHFEICGISGNYRYAGKQSICKVFYCQSEVEYIDSDKKERITTISSEQIKRGTVEAKIEVATGADMPEPEERLSYIKVSNGSTEFPIKIFSQTRTSTDYCLKCSTGGSISGTSSFDQRTFDDIALPITTNVEPIAEDKVTGDFAATMSDCDVDSSALNVVSSTSDADYTNIITHEATSTSGSSTEAVELVSESASNNLRVVETAATSLSFNISIGRNATNSSNNERIKTTTELILLGRDHIFTTISNYEEDFDTNSDIHTMETITIASGSNITEFVPTVNTFQATSSIEIPDSPTENSKHKATIADKVTDICDEPLENNTAESKILTSNTELKLNEI